MNPIAVEFKPHAGTPLRVTYLRIQEIHCWGVLLAKTPREQLAKGDAIRVTVFIASDESGDRGDADDLLAQYTYVVPLETDGIDHVDQVTAMVPPMFAECLRKTTWAHARVVEIAAKEQEEGGDTERFSVVGHDCAREEDVESIMNSLAALPDHELARAINHGGRDETSN